MILHCLDHHLVLLIRVWDLHAPRAPDARVRHVAVAADLIGRVDDDNALAEVVGAQARQLTDCGRL